jgi:hypothetical protein
LRWPTVGRGKPKFDWIAPDDECDGDGGRRGLGGQRCPFSARSNENTHGLAYEIGSEFSKSLPLTNPPAVFDRRILTLDEAALAQTSSECLYQMPGIVW